MYERATHKVLRIDLELLYDKLTGKVNEVNSRMCLQRKRNLNEGKLEKKAETLTLRIEEKESALSNLWKDVERVKLKGGQHSDLIELTRNLDKGSQELSGLQKNKRTRLDEFLLRQREVVKLNRARERLNESTQALLRSKEQLEKHALALAEPIQLMAELSNEDEVRTELLKELAGLRAFSAVRTMELDVKKQKVASYKAALLRNTAENQKCKSKYQEKHAEIQKRGQEITEFSTDCTTFISQLDSQLESTELNLETIQDSIDLVEYTIQQTMRNNI